MLLVRKHTLVCLIVVALGAAGVLTFLETVDASVARPHNASQAGLQVLQPDGTADTLAEIDDFATMQIGDPWDMAEPTDLQQFRTHASLVENERFAGGVFYANLTRGDGSEYIMPLYAGAVNNDAMRIGRIGYTYPINADHYRYLTFRMYTDGPVCRTGLLFWSEDDTRDDAVSGVSNSYSVPPEPCRDKTPGWHIYTLDLKTIGIQKGQKPWGGVIRELRIIPVGGVPVGTQVRIDWIRLTAQDPTTARPYTIRWEGGNGQVQIFASRGNQQLDADDQLIATVDAAQGQFDWQTGVMEAGTYHIYVTDGTAGDWSPGPVVLNAPPVGEILKPSMTSGPEFAALELGNTWNMNDASDINLSPPSPFDVCMDLTQFASGVFSARTPRCPDFMDHNDPIIFLGGMDSNPPGTPDPEVNTQKYRYLSFRYYMEGEQNMPGGWVGRFYWWKANATDNGVIEPPTIGRDIILYEGWNTYKLDLTAPDAVDDTNPDGIPWQQAHPNRLRLDPNELLPEYSPGYIHLDWVKLSAMDEIARGTPYPILFSTTESDVSIQLYFDSDRNPTNGRSRIQVYQTSMDTRDRIKIFLPTILRSHPTTGFLPEGQRILWDTTNVPVGQYWISIDLDDGQNQTTWYSEVPLIVK